LSTNNKRSPTLWFAQTRKAKELLLQKAKWLLAEERRAKKQAATTVCVAKVQMTLFRGFAVVTTSTPDFGGKKCWQWGREFRHHIDEKTLQHHHISLFMDLIMPIDSIIPVNMP